MTEPEPATLHGYGRRPWEWARTLLAGCTCAWTDIDGFHLEPADRVPVTLAGTTHLWGWSEGRYVRLRLDDDHAYAAVLHLGAFDEEISTEGASLSEPVRVTLHEQVCLWGSDDPQAGPLPKQLSRVDLLEIPGEKPVTFVRTSPAKNSDD